MAARTGTKEGTRLKGLGSSARGLDRLPSRVLKFCRKWPLGALGITVISTIVVVALFAPLLAPHDPKEIVAFKFAPLSREFPMSTDQLGRDVLSRIIYGARISLYVGLSAVGVGLAAGMLWGTLSAYYEGLLDVLSQRLVDAMIAFPGLVLALALMAGLGPSINNVIIALSFGYTLTATRTYRATVLSLKHAEYVTAAEAIGCSDFRIMWRHILPNTIAVFIILYSISIGSAIIAEASLSFLGVGAPLDEPTWGGMLNKATAGFLAGSPWVAVFPGLILSIAVYAFNMVGDTARDIYDPRLRQG